MTARRLPQRRGYTLIEMSVVITILALMAIFVVPRVIALQNSRRFQDLQGAIIRLPREARNEARRSGQPVTLRLESNTLIEERTPIQGSAEMVKQIPLDNSFQVDRAQQGDADVDSASWKWVVYPDGTAEKAGLEFSGGTTTHYLLLPDQGDPVWNDGSLPDPNQERWSAGDLLKRG